MSVFSLIRKGYTAGKGLLAGLPADIAERDPIVLLGEWFTDAQKAGVMLPESMCLATCTPDGRPSARMVLLKGIGVRSIVFYTNYESRKGEELKANPRAAAILHWPVLQRQVRIEGSVDRLEREESEAYFHSRDHGSQIGAWASRQSRPLESRSALEQRAREMHRRFDKHTVPLPEFWGGFRIHIHAIEFWQGRANRLHDRMRFDWQHDTWQTHRLYP
ncbi:MAG: Pyridoxine/pyridoxamine 5'-phosphate oxidase [Gammaproteobacteria bacterium]|nr:Pyridoxine/pyridoxamine 5'-phosphate oxidase [Gammaproteobacteria bacterium]